MIMSKVSYNDRPNHVRERLEHDFRSLLLSIPAWRRAEIEKEVRDSGYAKILEEISSYTNHWHLPTVDVSEQISAWDDYIDPVSDKLLSEEK